MTTTLVTLDVWQPNDIRVKVNQGEINSRFLQIKIVDKNKPFNLTDKTVIFYATKPDGNLIFNYCEIVDAQKGTVNLAMTSQMSIIPGIMRDCEIDIIDAGATKLKVKGLSIEIARCTDFEAAVESTSEFTALDETLADVQKIMDAYSDENIMEKIMSMDGEDSGLDADLLDGKHGKEYATAEQGKKADTAIQKIKGNGVEIPMSSDKTINITPADINAVPTTRRINDNPLSSDITLTPQNIGAALENHGNHIPAPQIAKADTFLRNDNSWQSITPQDIGAATAEQGQKADSSIQGLRVNGVNLPPNANQILDVETADLGAVPITRKINNQSLFEDVKLTATDLGAATSAQGIKADTAIQGILLNGKEITPSGGRIVDILTSDLSDATEEQWQKADSALQGIKGNGSMIPMDENNVVNVTPHIIGAVPVTRKVNGKSLADDVTITLSDFGGATAGQGAKADTAIQGVKLNGTLIEPDSQKIVDLVVSGGGSTSVTYTAEIFTVWTTGESGEYLQTIEISGILATDNPVIDLIQSTSIETAKSELEAWSLISKITTQNDSITVYCYDSAPSVNLNINLLCVR